MENKSSISLGGATILLALFAQQKHFWANTLTKLCVSTTYLPHKTLYITILKTLPFSLSLCGLQWRSEYHTRMVGEWSKPVQPYPIVEWSVIQVKGCVPDSLNNELLPGKSSLFRCFTYSNVCYTDRHSIQVISVNKQLAQVIAEKKMICCCELTLTHDCHLKECLKADSHFSMCASMQWKYEAVTIDL